MTVEIRPAQRTEHMWVAPEHPGVGIGAALFEHAVETARAEGAPELRIASDPNAEGFYKRMGAHRVGTSTKDVAGPNRELPILIYEFDHAGSDEGS